MGLLSRDELFWMKAKGKSSYACVSNTFRPREVDDWHRRRFRGAAFSISQNRGILSAMEISRQSLSRDEDDALFDNSPVAIGILTHENPFPDRTVASQSRH